MTDHLIPALVLGFAIGFVVGAHAVALVAMRWGPK